MPRYVLEIHEHDGSITEAKHESGEGDWCEVGQILETGHRYVRVVSMEDVETPLDVDQKLICTPL